MENIQVLTQENVVTFLIVLMALIWSAKQVMGFVESIKRWRRPQETKDEILASHREACAKKFANDKLELEKHGKRLDDLESGQCVMCKGLHALLEHALHNGNSDEMKKASASLFDYLNGR